MGDDFVTHLRELLDPLGAIRIQPMFGGFGVYRNNLMFGLVAYNTLYLKADRNNQGQFEERGLGPFVYEGKGKPVAMSYYEAPAEALDSPVHMEPWARSAYGAAVRSASGKKKATAAKKTARRGSSTKPVAKLTKKKSGKKRKR